MTVERKIAMSVFGSTVNGCWNSDPVLDHESSNLIGEITRVLHKEAAHPFIKSLLIGTLNAPASLDTWRD